MTLIIDVFTEVNSNHSSLIDVNVINSTLIDLFIRATGTSHLLSRNTATLKHETTITTTISSTIMLPKSSHVMNTSFSSRLSIRKSKIWLLSIIIPIIILILFIICIIVAYLCSRDRRSRSPMNDIDADYSRSSDGFRSSLSSSYQQKRRSSVVNSINRITKIVFNDDF